MPCPVLTGLWGPAEGEALSQLGKEGLLAQHRRAFRILTSGGNQKKGHHSKAFLQSDAL